MLKQVLRKDNFIDQVNKMGELKDNKCYLYNTIFKAQMFQKKEDYNDGLKITEEFRDGKLDPSNKTSNYERKIEFKKRQRTNHIRKIEAARAYNILPASMF